jgi:hypothetical protein
MNSLQSGCFYSSTGPEILDFRVAGDAITIRTSPAAAIYLVGGIWQGDRIVARPGESVCCFERARDPSWRYVRAVVVDAYGRKAWTNPIQM